MRLERNAKEFFEPNLYLFDAYPGGIGFSEPLFRAHELLVAEDVGTDPGLPVRGGVPFVRGTGGRFGAKGEGGSAGDFGAVNKRKNLTQSAQRSEHKGHGNFGGRV